MADKVISATLKVNTGTAASDIGNVNKQLGNTQKELGKTTETSKTTTESFTNLKDGLGKIPGPLSGVTKGIDTVQTSLKALAANPIVLVVTLLVAALVALYKAFASTESGAEKIEQVFAGLGAIVTVIRDRFLALAGAIAKFFSGDFSGAVQDAKAAVTGIGDAVATAYTKTANATKALQEADDDLHRNIEVNRAKLNRDLARSKELISDETASYADRKKAVNDVRDAQAKQAAAELANAKKTLDAKKVLADQDKENAEAQDDYAKATANFYAIQQQAAADARAINKQDAAIEKENQDKKEQAAKDADAKAKERAANLAAFEANLNKLRQDNYLGSLKDTFTKAEEQIRINQENELKALQDQLTKRIITKEQFLQLEFEIEKKYSQQYIDLKAKEDAPAIVTAADQAKDIADKKAADQAIADKKEQEAFVKHSATMRKLGDSALKKEVDAQRNALVAKTLIQKLEAIADSKQVAAIQNTANTLSKLFGEKTAAGKAFAIVGATIDTFRSAVAAYAGMVSAFPGPVGIAAGALAAAASVALGIKNIKAITAVKVPGQGDSGGSPSIDAGSFSVPSAPVAPTQTGTSIDQNSIAGIGNAVSGRSYVLSQDVTHDQDRNERLNRAARLGGG